MRCPECRGTVFDEGQFQMAFMHRHRPAVVSNVPAHRCRQCGYDLISPETARRLEQALASSANGFVYAAAYDLAEAFVGGSEHWWAPSEAIRQPAQPALVEFGDTIFAGTGHAK